LGVEDREDLDELVSFFFEDSKSDKTSVHPNDIIKVAREFVVKRQASKSKDAGDAGASTKNQVVSKAERKRERERQFWYKLGHVIPDKTIKMWRALETSQRDYNNLLETRAKLIDETTELARQNEELKVLLQEYLGSKINQELQVPPTRLIRVD
jgi:dynein regulatory complex protein 1